MSPAPQHASTADDDSAQPSRRTIGWVRAGLVAYWLALFAATHLPSMPQLLAISHVDKLLHMLAYAGLAFLLAMVIAQRRPISRRLYLQIWCLVAIYGIVDEVLQTFVGRDCEFGDWAADAIGAAIGLACFHLILGRRRKITPQS